MKEILKNFIDTMAVRLLLGMIKYQYENRATQLHYTLRHAAPGVRKLTLTFRLPDGKLASLEATGTPAELGLVIDKVDKLHFYQRPSLDG